MKNLILATLVTTSLLLSCGGKNSYEMEIFYSEGKTDGDTTMVSKKDKIVADSDSAAFVKAQQEFSDKMNKANGEKEVPVKFTLRNHDGVMVTQPGQQNAREVEKPMYPNQKP